MARLISCAIYFPHRFAVLQVDFPWKTCEFLPTLNQVPSGCKQMEPLELPVTKSHALHWQYCMCAHSWVLLLPPHCRWGAQNRRWDSSPSPDPALNCHVLSPLPFLSPEINKHNQQQFAVNKMLCVVAATPASNGYPGETCHFILF